MKISYNWLRTYLNITTDPETTAKLLTDGGLEVEGLERTLLVRGGLEGLIVGEVKTKEQHSNADKLSVTTVDVGGPELLSIVCGAPNVAAGQKVVIAPVGSVLYPLEGDEFKIKRSKIRGELSEGMICAEDEIGLGTDHDGIIELDQAAVIGEPASNYFDIGEDYTIEIGLTPNRADAASHYGVARDLRAILMASDLDVDVPELVKPDVSAFKVDSTDKPVEVVVEDAEACPRYVGLTIGGVKVGPSPDWLQQRLTAIGLKPINNVVDVTNFVLHETGQPLHAFDLAEVTDHKVLVKQLPEGTPFVTLDEEERKLSAHDLMICNPQGGMCIAGVFGGIKSGVTEVTTDLFLESAYFHPVSVRKTAKRHGLNTDASFRFERGIDPNNTVYAAKRAALLIQEVAGGTIASEISDFYPEPIQPFKVSFSYERCNKLIGQAIEPSTVKAIFESLEIEIVEETEDGLVVSVPPFKVDVQREADLIEEVLRVYGYNNIAVPEQVRSSLSFRPNPDLEKLVSQTSDFLSNRGFTEIMSNSLTRSGYFEEGSPWEASQHVYIANPLSSELDVLRRTLLYSGLEAVAHNQNRQVENLAFYEFGKTYAQAGEEGYQESRCLSLFMTGQKAAEAWNAKATKVDFFHLKGQVVSMIERLGLHQPGVVEVQDEDPLFTDGLQLQILKKTVARIGRLKQNYLDQLSIRNPVFYAEIDWEVLISLLKVNKVKFSEIPRFPSVRRDFALLVDQSVSFAEIARIARTSEKKILRDVNLFDVYEGDKIEAGKKSYAVSFTFRDTEKTLTDKQVDKMMKGLQFRFEKELGAAIR